MPRLDSLYFEAEFGVIVAELGDLPWDSLSADQKLLLLECRSRTGGGWTAKRALADICADCRDSGAWEKTAAAVALSIGRFTEADSLIDLVLSRNPLDLKARLTKATLQVYFGKTAESRGMIDGILEADSSLAERFHVYEIAHEILAAARDWSSLSRLCGLLARKYSREGNVAAAGNLVRDSVMYAGVDGGEGFYIDSREDKIELPLIDPPMRG